MRLRHFVKIQRRTTSTDGVGQVKEIWTDAEEVWANILPVNTREYFNASGERAEVTHKISTWYGPSISPRDRISYDGRLFDIKGVMNVGERNRQLQLMCVEVV